MGEERKWLFALAWGAKKQKGHRGEARCQLLVLTQTFCWLMNRGQCL